MKNPSEHKEEAPAASGGCRKRHVFFVLLCTCATLIAAAFAVTDSQQFAYSAKALNIQGFIVGVLNNEDTDSKETTKVIISKELSSVGRRPLSVNAVIQGVNGSAVRSGFMVKPSDVLSNTSSRRKVEKYYWLGALSKEFLATHASHVNTDIRDTLKLEQLPFLQNYRNPCWIEELPSGLSPYKAPHKFEMMRFKSAQLPVSRKFPARKQADKPYRMRCLPFYYIIGPQKSGTTDLYDCIVRHPQVAKSMAKEPHWWPRSRLASTTLSEYVDLYDEAAEKIASNVLTDSANHTFHHLITGEATAELIWDNWLWPEQPENMAVEEGGRPTLRYLMLHHIHHVTPQVRVIAMLRDPISRLWSDYNYFGHSFTASAADFARRVSRGLEWLRTCMSHVRTTADRWHCMYDPVPEVGSKYGSAWNPVVRLRMGMYSELLVDWYDTFPREQILILKMEDYARDRLSVLDRVFEFLELDRLPETSREFLRSKSVSNTVSKSKYSKSGQIDAKTYQALKDFYRPYNEAVAQLTGNKDFLEWNNS